MAELFCTIPCLGMMDERNKCQRRGRGPGSSLAPKASLRRHAGYVPTPGCTRYVTLRKFSRSSQPSLLHLCNAKIGQGRSHPASTISGSAEGQREFATKSKVSRPAIPAEAAGFLLGCQMHTQMGSLVPSPGRARWVFQARPNEKGITRLLHHLLSVRPVP